jgi:Chromo (CHRromatin Organisation MOdifier) domain
LCKAFNNGINYLVKLRKDGSRKQVCHAGNMKGYNCRDMTSLSWSLNPPEEFEENPYYVVEEIRDSRVNDEGNTEYFVKWKDYGEENCTWEPIECLANATEALEEFQRKSGERDPEAPASTRKKNSQTEPTRRSARLRK